MEEEKSTISTGQSSPKHRNQGQFIFTMEKFNPSNLSKENEIINARNNLKQVEENIKKDAFKKN